MMFVEKNHCRNETWACGLLVKFKWNAATQTLLSNAMILGVCLDFPLHMKAELHLQNRLHRLDHEE